MAWSGGLAEWRDGNTVFLSVAFTWKIQEAYSRAVFARAQGLDVVAGGPALFLPQCQHRLDEVATIRLHYAEAVTKHNSLATFASRGCPVGCWFCVVPALEGHAFTLLPDFVPRPVLCDNNLSGLPGDYQDYIIRRYQDAGVALSDANSGFEPLTFTPAVFERWKPLVNAGNGPWRFAYDELKERDQVLAVMRMLVGEPQKRKRVYVLIGNEPFDDCMRRVQEVLDHGCEPHCQPLMKLNAMERRPWVRFDWTEQRLRDVARWANGWVWKRAPFSEYDRFRKSAPREAYDPQQGLFA